MAAAAVAAEAAVPPAAAVNGAAVEPALGGALGAEPVVVAAAVVPPGGASGTEPVMAAAAVAAEAAVPAAAVGGEAAEAAGAVPAVKDAAVRGEAAIALIPDWATDFILLSIAVQKLSEAVALIAIELTDVFCPGWKAVSSTVCGIMRSPVSMESAIAMRLTVQIFTAECHEHRETEDSLNELQALRNGLEDPALAGAAQTLLRLLFRLRSCSGEDIDIMLVWVRVLLQLRLGNCGRPRRAKLPFGTHRDYLAVEGKPDGPSPSGQVTSIMTSLQIYQDRWWSVEGVSLFASSFALKPILRSVLTDHRADAKTACAIEGVNNVTGWLPLAVLKYVHVSL